MVQLNAHMKGELTKAMKKSAAESWPKPKLLVSVRRVFVRVMPAEQVPI